jgi:nuclease S1
MKRVVACLLLFLLMPSQFFGWGQEGHRVVGAVGEAHLTQNAKRNIQSLIGNKSLASIATWADSPERTQHPETYNWHFVDIPKSAASFKDSRDCFLPNDTHPGAKTDHKNCVVDRITFFQKVLADKNASKADRIEALKFLVHFVGDVHQPFHAIGDEKGGNGVRIVLFGTDKCPFKGKPEACNLHAAWDDGMIQHTGMNQQAYVSHLQQIISEERLKPGSKRPEEWANSSHKLAQEAWLDDGGAVDDAYYDKEIKVVDQQLALAGLRLAALLNATFQNVSPNDFKN